jgi:hypothetical protein
MLLGLSLRDAAAAAEKIAPAPRQIFQLLAVCRSSGTAKILSNKYETIHFRSSGVRRSIIFFNSAVLIKV